jgi:peptide/nickel transport system permease protein
MYLVMALAYSLVFNGIAETGLRAQADDEAVQVLRAAGPLGPADAQKVLADAKREKARQYHLDEPWTTRVLWRTLDVLTFHFGLSTGLRTAQGDREVVAIVSEALPNTLLLFTTEAAVVLALGVAVGLRAARKQGGLLDRTASVVPMVTGGVPVWWVGMLALMAFSYALPLFPAGGIRSYPAPVGPGGVLDFLWHLTLPLAVLVGLNFWNPAWVVRNLLVDTFSQDFITAARGRGLSERRIRRHALATIRPAVATLVVLGLLQSLSGNILIEGIFQWPGLGNLYFAAVQQNDVPVLMAILSLQTSLNLAGLVGLDLLYGRLDPRIRTGDRG